MCVRLILDHKWRCNQLPQELARQEAPRTIMRNHIAAKCFTSGIQIQEPPSWGSGGQKLDVLVVSVAAVAVVSLLVVRVVELQSPLSVNMPLIFGATKANRMKKNNPTLSLIINIIFKIITYFCQWCIRCTPAPQCRLKRSSIPPSGPEMYFPNWWSAGIEVLLVWIDSRNHRHKLR